MKKDKKTLTNVFVFEEMLNKTPIRTEIEVLGPDDVKSMKLGWIMEENIGIGIVSPKLTWYRKLWFKIRSFFTKSKTTLYKN